MRSDLVQPHCGRGLWLLLAAGLGGAACGGGDGGQYRIPPDERAQYRIDCAAYCAAEAVCLAVPADSDCERRCPAQRRAGGWQAAYLDTRYDCVLALGPDCDQAALDACRDQALAACAPAAGLDDFAAAWCRRWLSCHDSPVEPLLDRCLDDFAASPDHPLYACLTGAALEQLGRCLADADCRQITTTPVLTYCAEVYR